MGCAGSCPQQKRNIGEIRLAARGRLPAGHYRPKPRGGNSEVIELRVAATLVPRDDASKFTYATEKYFINGREIKNESGESSVAAYDDSKVPYGTKQGYGIFVTNRAYIKGSFPIRYFNVLSPN
jgi:hypothetical protein